MADVRGYSPMRIQRSAKFATDQLKRKHQARARRDLTLSQIVEAAVMVAEQCPEAMDNALAIVLAAESGRTHDGTTDG